MRCVASLCLGFFLIHTTVVVRAATESSESIGPLTLVESGRLELPTGTDVTGFALDPEHRIFAVSPSERKVFVLEKGRVVRALGTVNGTPLARLPWDVGWSRGRIYVVDREPEHPSVVVLDPKSGQAKKSLAVPATPGVAELPDGRLVMGFRHLYDSGKMDMLHVYSAGGKHLRSMFPEDPHDADGSPFAAAGANELAFDTSLDGRIFALQAFDNKIRVFNSDGKQLNTFDNRCSWSREPTFGASPVKFDWDQRAWDRWRDSWSRKYSLYVVGSNVIVRTINAIGTPGWVDIFDLDGRVVSGCLKTDRWPVARAGNLLLMVGTSKGKPGSPDRYYIYETRTSKIRADVLPDPEMTVSSGEARRLTALIKSPSTALILVDPNTCSACMEERHWWKRVLAGAPCATGKVIVIVQGVKTVDEYRAYLEYVDLPFSVVWDSKETLRGYFESRDDVSLPLKVVVSNQLEILRVWSGTAITGEQEKRVSEMAAALGCGN